MNFPARASHNDGVPSLSVNRRMRGLLLLLLVSVLTAFLTHFQSSPSQVSAQGAQPPTKARNQGAASTGLPTSGSMAHQAVPLSALDRRQLDLQLFGPESPVRNPFRVVQWTSPPNKPSPVVQERPSAPTLPFTYLGKKLEGGRWEVFVDHKGTTRILQTGSEWDGTYRVESIVPPSMSVIYLPLHERQVLSIGPAP